MRRLSELWFTRCPVPTATGIAYQLGWLTEAFAGDGNMLAIGARAQGEPTKLVGLTWIEESQLILTRPDTGIRSAADLKGRRLALPGWSYNDIPAHVRGTSIARGMSLAGYKGVLASAGLTLDDVDLIETLDPLRDIGGVGRDLAGLRPGAGRLWRSGNWSTARSMRSMPRGRWRSTRRATPVSSSRSTSTRCPIAASA